MHLPRAENLDRLLLILALAYLILCGLGLYALKHPAPAVLVRQRWTVAVGSPWRVGGF
jgi:hypothetical protein